MKCDVGLDQLLDVLGLGHALQDLRQLRLLLGLDASGGQRGDRRLEDAPDLVELDLGVAEEQVADEVGALEQEAGLEAAHVSPIALLDLEHAQLGERTHRFTQ